MPNVRYAFIAQNRLIFAVRAMCRMLLVHPSGFYALLREPFSQRALEDQRQTVLLKQAWDDSGEVYGYPLPGRRLHRNLPRGASCMTICVISAKTSAQTGLGVWPVWRA